MNKHLTSYVLSIFYLDILCLVYDARIKKNFACIKSFTFNECDLKVIEFLKFITFAHGDSWDQNLLVDPIRLLGRISSG